jgi:hypothetical protein
MDRAPDEVSPEGHDDKVWTPDIAIHHLLDREHEQLRKLLSNYGIRSTMDLFVLGKLAPYLAELELRQVDIIKLSLATMLDEKTATYANKSVRTWLAQAERTHLTVPKPEDIAVFCPDLDDVHAGVLFSYREWVKGKASKHPVARLSVGQILTEDLTRLADSTKIPLEILEACRSEAEKFAIKFLDARNALEEQPLTDQ